MNCRCSATEDGDVVQYDECGGCGRMSRVSAMEGLVTFQKTSCSFVILVT